MKLIVGLGNIGRKYEKTRHNIGFEVLEALAARCPGASVKEKCDGRLMDAMIAGERSLLLWPYTLMNRSGKSAKAAADFYQLLSTDLLVVATILICRWVSCDCEVAARPADKRV